MSEEQPFGIEPTLLAQDRRRFIHRSDRVILELPDITSGLPVFAAALHSFATAYVTGGMPVSLPLPVVPNRTAVFIAPKGGYTFDFVEPDLVQAWFGGGGEVPNGTDLSYLGTTRVIVQGSRGSVIPLVEVSESWRVSSVSIEVGEDVDAAAASWMLRAQVVRRSLEVEEFGAIDTSLQELLAGTRYDFFSAVGPGDAFDLLAGDMLRLHVVETQAAPALCRPVVTIKRRKL